MRVKYLLAIGLICACARTPSPTLPVATPQAVFTSTPSNTATLPHTQTPLTPRTLTICLADEPQSLYLYARPEAGRDHLLAALYDGPIDNVAYGYQPVLLEKLPRVADGDAVVQRVRLNAGEGVVDEMGRVVTLTTGVIVNLLDGEQITYNGSGPITVPQMVVTFRLKPGVLWSDGQPLTAADSVFSFEVAKNPDSFDLRRALAERTASYRASDKTTVEWVGLPGYIDPLYFTNFWTPLPRHVYGGLSPTEIADSPEANRNPLGWGPFVLREWVSGDHLTFERNPNYFRAPEGMPWADRVTYRIIPNPAQLVDELRAGRCEVVPQSPALEAVSDGLAQANALNEARLQVGGSTTLEHLDFGVTPAPDYARGVGNAFFQDGRVRQAVAYCLNRLALSPSSAGGGESLATYLPDTHPLLASGVSAYRFDPTQGRALLAELGWADSDGDGTLDKDGAPLELTLVTGPSGEVSRENVAHAIRDQLRENCGIEIEIYLLTRGELEGDWPDGVVFGRRFDLALFGWKIGSVPPCELFTTAQIPGAANPGGANDTGYSDPQFDAACRRALTTLDPQPTAQHHAEAQRLFAQDLPMLPLFFGGKLAAARPEVLGFALDPTSPSELWNIEALSLVP